MSNPPMPLRLLGTPVWKPFTERGISFKAHELLWEVLKHKNSSSKTSLIILDYFILLHYVIIRQWSFLIIYLVARKTKSGFHTKKVECLNSFKKPKNSQLQTGMSDDRASKTTFYRLLTIFFTYLLLNELLL